ncbi:MAG: acetyltransferase [Phycisphaerales bacterium JB063]
MFQHPPPHSLKEEPPVIIIGAGGHARVLLGVLKMLGRQVLYFTDDAPKSQGKIIDGIRVQGAQEEVLNHSPHDVVLVNGIGSVSPPVIRQQVYHRFSYRGYRFATIIHPDVLISPSAQIAQGAQLMAGTIVQAGALIGANTILNTRCSVDHDCVIGAHTHIAPGVTLSGKVSVGQMCHLGTGATVIQGIQIGHGTLVGAGAVVVRDVPASSAICGVPAKAM